MGTVGAQKVRVYLANHTQEELARELGARLNRKVHQATVSAYACGRFVPRGQAMVALRAVVGAELEDWLTPAHESEPPPPLSKTGTDQ